MDVDVAKRHVAHEFESHHDHARDPEKKNIETCDKRRSRIKILQILGLFRPAQRRERPQAGRKPGVEHVGVLNQILAAARRTAFPGLCRATIGLASLPSRYSPSAPLIKFGALAACQTIPGGNLVAPPNLSRDAPVFDVFHPGEIGIAPAFGNNLDLALAHGRDRRFRQRLDIDKPLRRQVWLDDRLAAIAATHRELMRLGFFEKALFLQFRDDQFPRFETIFAAITFDPFAALAAIQERSGVDARVGVEDTDLIQAETVADVEIVKIVSGRDLQRAGAEFAIDQWVGDERHDASGNWQANFFADQILDSARHPDAPRRQYRRAWFPVGSSPR